MGPSRGIRPPETDVLVEYEVEDDESLSEAVLRAAGEVIDDLTAVRPLASVVDVEALDHLFERRRDPGSDTNVVAFAAWDLWFVVTATSIEIYEIAEVDGR
jgi:hypothetical protein